MNTELMVIPTAKKSRRRRLMQLFVAAVVVVGGAAVSQASFGKSDAPVVIPAPVADIQTSGHTLQKAVFAGGCFWGIQGVFQHVKGVTQAVSGYAGGAANTARYEIVSGGRTGHAEAVEVTYDPAVVSYGQLLQVLFSVGHNPTELNRQGPDIGTQYRSALFPVNAEQARVAKSYIQQLNDAHVFPQAIVTKIESDTGFYKAEAYHQDFLTSHPNNPYIVINDLPKVEALKTVFPARYSSKPVLVGTM